MAPWMVVASPFKALWTTVLSFELLTWRKELMPISDHKSQPSKVGKRANGPFLGLSPHWAMQCIPHPAWAQLFCQVQINRVGGAIPVPESRVSDMGVGVLIWDFRVIGNWAHWICEKKGVSQAVLSRCEDELMQHGSILQMNWEQIESFKALLIAG